MNYYRDEHYGFSEWERKLNLADATELTRELCRFANLPEIKVGAQRKNGGTFYWRNFRYSFDPVLPVEFRITYASSVSVRTVVHEVAHYWDYYNRYLRVRHLPVKDLEPAGPIHCQRLAERKRIYKQHAHSRRHWALMKLLFQMIVDFKDCSAIFAKCLPSKPQWNEGVVHAIHVEYRLSNAESRELLNDIAKVSQSLDTQAIAA